MWGDFSAHIFSNWICIEVMILVNTVIWKEKDVKIVRRYSQILKYSKLYSNLGKALNRASGVGGCDFIGLLGTYKDQCMTDYSTFQLWNSGLHYISILYCFKRCIWERECKGERESQADSVLNAEPNFGLDLTTHEIVTRAKIKSWMLNWLHHLGMPSVF